MHDGALCERCCESLLHDPAAAAADALPSAH